MSSHEEIEEGYKVGKVNERARKEFNFQAKTVSECENERMKCFQLEENNPILFFLQSHCFDQNG